MPGVQPETGKATSYMNTDESPASSVLPAAPAGKTLGSVETPQQIQGQAEQLRKNIGLGPGSRLRKWLWRLGAAG